MDDHLQSEERRVQELRTELAARRGRERRAWNDLPGLREEVRRAVELSSVRQVAGAIGTSHEGLRRFLNGGKPYPATLQKIVRWAERAQQASAEAERAREAGRDAFDLVTRGLSPQGKARVREAMRRALLESGDAVPPWLDEGAE
ncbi:MAG TPA: hypothetical protein VHG51_07875 [Longimicrobiaceae bacterium]|nr:hypothetical protein [Longimicrobiaceae bacterium]